VTIDYASLLEIAIAQARIGLAEGGIPIGAALLSGDGRLLGEGRNRRIQDEDPSAHAETNAFRLAGRQRSYRDTIMVTTLAPCFYCSGLIRQFNIPTVVYGESRTFAGGLAWLGEAGVQLFDQDSDECAQMMTTFIATRPDVWFEDIGEEPQ
jgi:cytosine deaminase